MRKFPGRHRAVVSALKNAREKAGLSQRELSRKLKQGVTYIQEIESGERGVQTAEFIEIALACDRNPAELIDEVTQIRRAK